MRPTSAGLPPRAMPAAAGSETPTSPYGSLESSPRWLIQVDGGEFQLVESERELAELARLGRVTGSTPVYTVVDGPRPLGEISDLVTFAPRPVISEPPVRFEPPIRRDGRSSERARLSEELAVLNQPLDDEIEYYDETPSRRWPKRVALLLALAAGALGAYLFVAPRVSGLRSSVTARLVLPARSWVAGSKPVAATPPQPAVPAVSARAESGVAVAAPGAEPVPAALPPARAETAPALAPAIEATTLTATTAGAAPVADRETHKPGRSHRRHLSGNHAATRR